MPAFPTKKRTSKYVRKGNKGTRTSTLVSTIKKVVKAQAETKAHIRVGNELGYSTLTSPAFIPNLNTIVQGDSKHHREGNMIMPTYIDIRGQIQATNQEAVWYKVLLLEHNSARDPLVDLFEDDNGNFAGPGSDLTAIYARINTGKYKVLASRMLKTGTVSNTANDANAVQLFNMNKKLSGKMYFDEGSNIPNKRALSLVVFGRRANNDEVTGLGFEFSFNSKMYYKDM